MAGTPLVAGVTPGRSGQIIEGLPVYDTVAETIAYHETNASVIFVPAPYARDAAFEAIQAGLQLVVIVTEHIPVRDTMEIMRLAQFYGTAVIGPNSPGIFIPSIGKLGILPESIFRKGRIRVIGRSATLSYEVIANLTAAALGQTAAIGVGGDPVVCTEFSKVLELFEVDQETAAVVLVGEIGGSAEEQAADFISRMSKPVVALIAGKAAPPGKRFGHAGAMIRASGGSAQHKIDTLRQAGATIAGSPSEIPTLLKERLENKEVHL